MLGVLVGAGWLVVRSPVTRELTSYDARISNADPLLAQAERAMRAEVHDRHGTKAADARCYYTTDPGAGRHRRPPGPPSRRSRSATGCTADRCCSWTATRTGRT